jgi:hypothetical protein
LSQQTETKTTKDMKTSKAKRNEWREKVMNALNLSYTLSDNQIVYKGSLGNYKTLLDLLVNERIKLGILPY